jgi:tetratricopeptide (TPR) repeat protein
MIKFTLQKHLLGFALLIYFLFELMIGNLLMDIGATMGERLIFHSSIGFCMALAYGLIRLLNFSISRSLFYRKLAATLLVSVTGTLYCAKTWERDLDWKNDITLFLKDVQTMPNSVLCLGNAGARYVDLSNTCFITGEKKEGYDTLFNDFNGTLSNIPREVRLGYFKNNRDAVMHHGIEVLTRAIALHPRYVNGYLNLGLLHLQLGNDFETLYYLKNAERLYPNNPYLLSYYNVYKQQLHNRVNTAYLHNNADSLAIIYNLLTVLEPTNAGYFSQLGNIYFNQGKRELARRKWESSLRLNPQQDALREYLRQLMPPEPAEIKRRAL